jgi:transaldolase
MKLFLDTADTTFIKKWAPTGLIDGVTTNPTHLSKCNGNPTDIIKDICQLLPHGVISVEVIETEPDKVYHQARAIAELAPNIAVKIPCHQHYYTTIKKLVAEHITINITLVFSVTQALMMAKLSVAYISPFIGRLDDIKQDGMHLIIQLRHMLDTYHFSTNLLAASIRDVTHFEDVIIAGAHCATVPPAVFEQSLEHELTNKGMQQFLTDWKKLNISHFP